ncbi:unnamed protein product, partial [marine sediment metagenome]
GLIYDSTEKGCSMSLNIFERFGSGVDIHGRDNPEFSVRF